MDRTNADTPARAQQLIGRGTELDGLHRSWRAGGQVTFVRGPAGVGKSRLLRELAAWVATSGGVVLVGRSTPAAGSTPLRPVTEALLGAARRGARPDPELGPYASVLGRIVPDWAEPTAPEPTSDPVLLVGEALLRFAAQLSAAEPTLLVLEDLHWADPETVQVVEYVADNIADRPVVLVGSLRDGEPGPGTNLADALVQRRAAGEVALEPFGRDDVVALASACLGDQPLPDEVVEPLVSRSDGIPFLVEELVATAVGSGWETVGAAVPGSVLASVELRLEGLPADARRLLLAAALLGRHFDWRLAARAAGLDEGPAAELLRAGLRAQLLDVEDAGFRFHHALTRDAVLTVTPPAERSLAAREVLSAVELGDDAAGVEDLLLAADLARQADNDERAADLLARAARRALDDGALNSSDRFATQARELCGGPAATDIDELLLEICVRTGDTQRASDLGARLLDAPADPERLAKRHLLVASAHLAAGRWDAARHHADAATGLVPDDRAVGARIDALHAQAAMAEDLVDAALERASAALAGAEATGQAAVQCEALEVIGRVERGRDLGASEAAFQQSHDVAAAAGLAVWRVRALQELGTIDLFDSLRIDRLHHALDEALRIGAVATAAMVELQLAATHDERGELGTALDLALRCQERSRRFGLSTEPMSLMVQAMVHARRADRDAMDAALEAGRALGADADYVEASVWGNVVPIFHLVRGELAEAGAGFDRGMEVIRRRPAAALPYPGLWALVRTVLGDGGDRARAEVAALPFDTPASRRVLVAAEAVAAGRAGDAVAAAERFADADRQLTAAGGSFRRELVRLLVAPTAHADGWGEPATWLRDSLAELDRMGIDVLAGRCRAELRRIGAPVPRRSAVATSSVPAGLAGLGVTAREVDVLVLLAGGATNAAIAERLFISPRTVDKHVERLVQKTGRSRRDLAGVARDAGLLRT